MADTNDLVFVALGGLGEIGMNCALYGYGTKRKRDWIMVDLGVSFAGDDLPGVDLIMPDLSFIERIKGDLKAIIITHAHEDHIGALVDLWPKLKAPVYATPFATGLLEARRMGEPGAPKIPLKVVRQGDTIDVGPFSVEFIAVAHSIPESCALAIRTPAGVVVHTGDWKIDPTPGIGAPTNEARLKALGDEGVLALICDSTNVTREGESPSEEDVAKSLSEIVGKAKGRVLVTTFASNVARLRSAALAAIANGRQVMILGRAMERAVAVARELGYLEGLPAFLGQDSFDRIPRNQMLALATGSQGEPRAALARIAEDSHPSAKLGAGDLVVFSSRAIPGNEKPINAIINGLVSQGVDVITDRTKLVHVSGHPRRAELAKMYAWVRPKIAVPAHGEPLHLTEHVAFAKAQGVPSVARAFNGDMVRLSAEEGAVMMDAVSHGKVYKDGEILLDKEDPCVAERRKLSLAGVVSIAIAVSDKGDVVGDPDVTFSGLPKRGRDGADIGALIDGAMFETLDGLQRTKRRDANVVSGAVERAVRNAVNAAWGKKPLVHVMVIEA